MLSEKYLNGQARIHKRLQEIANEQAVCLANSPTGSIDLAPWRAETADLLNQSEMLIREEQKRLGLDLFE